MPCIASLVEDHALISRMLSALESFIHDTYHDEARLRRDLPRFVTFFEVYCDVHHASKLEEVLFPELVRNGVAWEAGALSQAREGHHRERHAVRALEHLAAREVAYDAEALRNLSTQLAEFARAMRAHLELERRRVFPLTEELAPLQQHELEARLTAFDESPPSSRDLPAMRSLAEQLIAAYPTTGLRSGAQRSGTA